MPEEILNRESEGAAGTATSPPPEEWVSLREAARVLNLTSTRQVRRRSKIENWRSRLVRVGGVHKRQVYLNDVVGSKRDVIHEVMGDVPHKPGTSLYDVSDKSHSSHRTDVTVMSQVVKDFLVVVNGIKDKFDGMIITQQRIVATQDRIAGSQDRAVRVVEERAKIGERRFRHERRRGVLWQILVVCIAGLFAVGGYYGYKHLLAQYQKDLALREKELGVMNGVYTSLLDSLEREVAKRDGEIERLRGRVKKAREEAEAARAKAAEPVPAKRRRGGLW